jgi:hypothetical protein
MVFAMASFDATVSRTSLRKRGVGGAVAEDGRLDGAVE